MRFLEQTSSHWIEWIVAASWQLAILVLFIAAAGWLCGALAIPSVSRVRHALWLIVLVKVFLPPTLASPIGIGNWRTAPISLSSEVAKSIFGASGHTAAATGTAQSNLSEHASENGIAISSLIMIAWAMGAIVFWCCVLYRHRSLTQVVRRQEVVDEGPIAISLEKAAIKLGIDKTPDLRITDALTSPFLLGVFRPCVVLPQQFVDKASEPELSAVLMHELVHMQRRDMLVGWVQIIAQGLFWFHPLVWWANRKLRHQREEACDDSVLCDGGVTPKIYGETMMRVLTTVKARSLAEGSLVGVFERGTNLQTRLEKIMNHGSTRRGFGWKHRIAILGLAAVLLPMSPSGETRLEAQEAPSKQSKPSPPMVVKTTPQVGATGVKASTKTIRVVFDRDMSSGMSWTGGPPEFPTANKNQKAKWINKRTCVLPVTLEKKTFYRVGINSKSHLNFRSADGVPAPPSAIYFATEGASKKVMARAQKPEVAKIVPANGATDVDPKLKEISVTFNMPMSSGMSWTGGGENFPGIPTGGKPKWSDDQRTCTIPVKLKASHQYHMGLNSRSHNNFKSKNGVPLTPVRYSFKTK